MLLALSGLVAEAACSRPFSAGVGALGSAYYVDANGPHGVVVDLLDELSRRTGCVFRAEMLPRQRVWAMYAQGEIDVVPAALKTPERDQSGVFVQYAASRTDLLLMPRDTPSTIRSMGDLQALPRFNLGVVRGVTPGGRVGDAFPALEQAGRLEYSPDYDQLFVKFQAGRLDAVLAPAIFYERKLKEWAQGNKVRIVRLPESVFLPTGIYFNHSSINRADRERLADAVKAMRDDGTVRAIYMRYLSAATVDTIMQGSAALLPDRRKR
ncbi:substrate-binding periplasmic protein [Chitinimonas naiadis]